MLRALVCLLLLANGCFSSGGDGPSLVGDWFPCRDGSDCAEIGDDGLRFAADGTWAELDTEDQAVGEGAICAEVGDRGGSYSFDGTTLRVTSNGQEMLTEVELRGDRLTLEAQQFGSDGSSATVELTLLRVPTFESDDCDIGDAPGIPDPTQPSP